jgi:histidyl-tRNA synthetase
MISQDLDSIEVVDEILRKIRIKQTQLKLAQASNMVYTSEVLQKQILELQHQLSASQDSELQSLMSLLED